MKKQLLTLFMCLAIPSGVAYAQTTIWSSDCESLAGWVGEDLDGDGSNWFYYSGGTPYGFAAGRFYGSPSASTTPDNVILTPVFFIPSGANNLLFEFKVGSSSATNFAETYAIYIQEVGVGGRFDHLLFQETLTTGGPGSVKNVDVVIPNSFAGKSVKLIIWHFNCNNQDFLLMDDYRVSSNSTLSIGENNFQEFSFGSNPSKDYLAIHSDKELTSLDIYNVLGKKVHSYKASAIVGGRIDVSFLSSGIYMMKIQIEEQSKVFKFIKS